MEKIARRQVIISTPAGRYQQGTLGENPHQEHRAFWHPAELKSLDYKVRGHGLQGLFGEKQLVSRIPKALRPLGNIVWLLCWSFGILLPQAGRRYGWYQEFKELR